MTLPQTRWVAEGFQGCRARGEAREPLCALDIRTMKMMTYYPYQPPNPYPRPPESRGMSIAALVLGIVSILGLWATMVVPLAGVIVGHYGYARERAGEGMAVAGLILSWISLALSVATLVVIFWLFSTGYSFFTKLYQVSDYGFA